MFLHIIFALKITKNHKASGIKFRYMNFLEKNQFFIKDKIATKRYRFNSEVFLYLFQYNLFNSRNLNKDDKQ